MIDVAFIDNRSGGGIVLVETRDGTTVAELAASIVGASVDLRGYMIRVNRKIAEHDHVLQNDDRVSFTPTEFIYD